MAQNRCWTKYELPRAALKRLPALTTAISREGAWRACVLSASAPVLASQLDYAVIKVPALEGTELWIAASTEQAAVEVALGFGKPSAPVLTLTGAELEGALVGESLEDTGETLS